MSNCRTIALHWSHYRTALNEETMPKLKTHRGAAKRFKKTGTGKFVRSKAFKRHILTSKPKSRKRHLRGTVVVAAVDQHRIKRMLPYD
jgi:large subunit ribosomal protein L35